MMKKTLLCVFMLAGLAVVNEPVSGQTVQNGPYYANPSWDQQIPATQRFIVLSNWNNHAVLDRETGLVWERTPISTTSSGRTFTTWLGALSSCASAGTGNRFGWRTPSIQELASLIDPANGNMLPAGNPFLGVATTPNFYWSSTTNADIFAWFVAFGGTGHLLIAADDKTDTNLTWCVRSGSGPDIQ
jgi:hypothetical protein